MYDVSSKKPSKSSFGRGIWSWGQCYDLKKYFCQKSWQKGAICAQLHICTKIPIHQKYGPDFFSTTLLAFRFQQIKMLLMALHFLNKVFRRQTKSRVSQPRSKFLQIHREWRNQAGSVRAVQGVWLDAEASL
jgi:hypothetical protein